MNAGLVMSDEVLTQQASTLLRPQNASCDFCLNYTDRRVQILVSRSPFDLCSAADSSFWSIRKVATGEAILIW